LNNNVRSSGIVFPWLAIKAFCIQCVKCTQDLHKEFSARVKKWNMVKKVGFRV
jgi:SET domain-containing protein